MISNELLSGLEEAIEANPENRALHLHLIALLLDNGMADRALSHCQWLLLYEPDNAMAMNLAAQSCDLMEDVDRAARYRRVCEALENS